MRLPSLSGWTAAAAASSSSLLLSLLFLCANTPIVDAFIDPISIGYGLGAVGMSALGYTGILKDQTLCRLTECCNDRHIPADVAGRFTTVRVIGLCIPKI